MGILELDNVALELGGKRILNGVSIDFEPGRIYAVVGPNGAGKSTLASAIMGLSGYTNIEGDIRFEGQSLRGASVDKRARLGLSLAWQEPARFEGLGVRSFLLAGARDKSTALAESVLEQVGLEPRRYLPRAVDKTLSGGERKRIELASILAMEPKVVLMDEPDSGIDVTALEHIFEALRVLKRQGTTVILITHGMTVLQQAEEAFLLCSGKVLDMGETSKIGQYFENKCLPCNHENQPIEGELE